jgi:hypothetical protein
MINYEGLLRELKVKNASPHYKVKPPTNLEDLDSLYEERCWGSGEIKIDKIHRDIGLSLVGLEFCVFDGRRLMLDLEKAQIGFYELKTKDSVTESRLEKLKAVAKKYNLEWKEWNDYYDEFISGK